VPAPFDKDNRQKQNFSSNIFNVGIYTRLSREDGDSSESESIANQKDFLTRYVLEQGWNLVDIFVDDGYTGTNFNRPDFQRLLKAIGSGQINLVITKDLSRLGRDYIDTGHYVERYFPQNNIRYIALNDGVDTFETNNTNNDMSPFKSVMNDFYARDISKKVRTSMNSKRKSGQFIGSFAPYGYLKSPSNKNKLEVDPQTAPVVKRIFEMYLAGSGLTHIANVLNDDKVLCPGVYKASQHAKYKNVKTLMGLWTAQTVKYILINPTYQGDLTQRKYSTISYKVKKLKATPRESWLTVQGTHEAIVDKATFETAQQIIHLKAPQFKTNTKKVHLLGGLLFCKDCGARMTFTKTQKGEWYCICSNNKRFKQCTRHSIIEDDLEKYIREDLRRIARSSLLNSEELTEEARQEAGKRKKAKTDRTAKEIAATEKRILEIKCAIQILFEDKIKGIITERDFIDLSQNYNQERDTLNAKLLTLSNLPQPQQEPDKDLLKIVWDLIDFKSLCRPMLTKLIKRIEVSEDKNIDIYYTFRDSP
jgi:site-specific DNA recombinase